MYLEFDWTFNVYRPRFGKTFTDIRGIRSYDHFEEVKAHLAQCGLKLGRKTDSRTWEIVSRD